MKRPFRRVNLLILLMMIALNLMAWVTRANLRSLILKPPGSKTHAILSKTYISKCSLKKGKLIDLKQKPIFKGYELGTEYTITFGENCPNEQCDESDPSDPCKPSTGNRCEACAIWRCICLTKPCDQTIF